LKELLADNDNLAIEAEIIHTPQLLPSPSELSTIKKMFMDLAKEKELSNIAEFAKTINKKPSSEWVLTDWELAIEKLEKLEKVEVAS
jgi:hypothetical protein